MKICARSPSNIAWIKYMGKRPEGKNLPENSSISLTLNGLCTWAELERAPREGHAFVWDSEIPSSVLSIDEKPVFPNQSVSLSGQERILHHLERVLLMAPDVFKCFPALGAFRGLDASEAWVLRAKNTFPMGAGIASSASSFSAVTAAALALGAEEPLRVKELLDQNVEFRTEAAHLSRLGSGSSCRSFFGPMSRWSEGASSDVSGVEHVSQSWEHWVLVIEGGEKQVSSSEAHQRCKTASLWNGRAARAEARFEILLERFQSDFPLTDFSEISALVWEEAMEMHQLFHTARPPFFYMGGATWSVLRAIWESPVQKFRPAIVTLDAGPNIHLTIWKKDRSDWESFLASLPESFEILTDQPGQGTKILSCDP